MSTKRTVVFTPIFMAEVDLKTGEVTGSFDWSDSCTGANSDVDGWQPGDTPLAGTVAKMLDDGPADFLERDYVIAFGPLPTSYVVTADGEEYGALVFATREEADAAAQRCRKQQRMYRDKHEFGVEEVRIPVSLFQNEVRCAAPTAAERESNDTYAGRIDVRLSVGLDETDPPIVTVHDYARLLLRVCDTPLNYNPGKEDD